MGKKELNFRIDLVLAKARNIYYYFCLDTRERVTYMHIVRNLRKNLIEVLNLIPNIPEYLEIRDYLLEMIRSIDPKIGTDDCGLFITGKLAELLKKRNLI